MKRRIGTITLQKQTTFHYAGYECAAWWKDVECNPQTVELWYSNDLGSRWILFTFHGKRTADYFGALWCGVAISKTPYVSREIGHDDSYSFQLYDYNLIALILNSEYKVILDADVRVTARVEVLGREPYDWEAIGGSTPKQSSYAHTAVFAQIDFAEAAA